MTIHNRAVFAMLLVLLAAMFSCKSTVGIYDDFEAPVLNKIWTNDRMVEGAFKTQSKIVRSGHSAAMITLKSGDVYQEGVGKSKDTERDELREAKKLSSIEGKMYEYRFSLFLPDSFPIVSTRLVIAQWKQRCEGNDSCSNDSPVIAIRYVSGKLSVTLQSDTARKTIFKTTEEVRNRWLDFKFKIRFSRLRDGQIHAWLNEKQIVNYAGPTCYSSKKGYPAKSTFYFKMGLYRDLMPEPMTIYVDEYRKVELSE